MAFLYLLIDYCAGKMKASDFNRKEHCIWKVNILHDILNNAKQTPNTVTSDLVQSYYSEAIILNNTNTASR